MTRRRFPRDRAPERTKRTTLRALDERVRGFLRALPRGAVRGDPTRQIYCESHHEPKYVYVDERKTCIQCEVPYTFRAAEQKFWYETLQFNFNSAPVRCPRCRRMRRSERALHAQIGKCKADAATAKTDPAAHLSVSRAIVEYHERTGRGRLDEAIAAARRAAELWPQSSEPLYWEGLAHARAGRSARARTLLQRFIDRGGSGRQHRVLASSAARRLETL